MTVSLTNKYANQDTLCFKPCTIKYIADMISCYLNDNVSELRKSTISPDAGQRNG